MNKTYLVLQATEQALVTSASSIYAGYLQAGKVPDGEEAHWRKRSIEEALEIAKEIDNLTVVETEMD